MCKWTRQWIFLFCFVSVSLFSGLSFAEECYITQPHDQFCNCMNKHLLDGCRARLGDLCSIDFIKQYIGHTKNGIESSCVGQSPFGHCVNSLTCYMNGVGRPDMEPEYQPCSGAC